MSTIARRRTTIAAQQAADYATQRQRYLTADPLIITCIGSSFASILSAAAAGREPIGDPPPDDVPDDDEDDDDEDDE
jgi:hypothetical protein